MLILEKNVENDGIRYPRVAIDFEYEKKYISIKIEILNNL